MYDICVLSFDTDTTKSHYLNLNSNLYDGLVVCKCVFPLELVSEFDSWLETKLKPEHVVRPSADIEEYIDPNGNWAGAVGLHVVYCVAVLPSKLEMIEHFASTFVDNRI